MTSKRPGREDDSRDEKRMEGKGEGAEPGEGSRPAGKGEEIAPEELTATAEVEVLKKELADKVVENQEITANLQRLQADFENYRKRMLKEQTRILETAEAALVKKLLEALDNLERALAVAEEGHDYDGLRDGVAMTLKQMFAILEKEGLEVINPLGELFDPNYHEAVMKVKNDDYDEDTVSAVLQKGYIFRGKLLRPAKVEVAA